ncbi:MAG: tetratricopeptide repeat protein [Bacteroidales bacterium]|nr:tetratricopeptide repeat protein [Bacteroidales bacterium]
MKRRIFYILLLFCAVQSAAAQDGTDFCGQIRRQLDIQNYNTALQILYAATEDDYYDIECVQRAACEAYYMTGDYGKCAELCGKLYNEDESSTFTDMLYMVVTAKQSRKNDSLVAAVAYDLGQKPPDKNILQQLAVISQRDIDNAAAAVSRYIVNNGISPDEDLKPYKTVLAILFFAAGHYNDSYNACIDYLTMDNYPVIYYILGVIKQQNAEYNSALSFFNMAIRNGYNHYDAYLRRAVCFGYGKDYVRSNIDLDTCLMIDSNYYVFYLKGINYNFMKQYQDAMNCLDYSISLNDTFADSYNYRGIVLSNMKEYAFAAMDFKNAVILDPKTPFVHNNYGIALEKTGKIQQAIEQYRISVKTEPQLSDAWYNLGRIYTDFKQTDKALKYLKRAAELDPDISDTYYLMGVNYQRKNDRQRACIMYQQALELEHTEAGKKIESYCNSGVQQQTVAKKSKTDKRIKKKKAEKSAEEDEENGGFSETDEQEEE